MKGRRGSHMADIPIHELFLIFKNGQREKIFYAEHYYDEEMNFLAYYINSYINNQIRL